MKNAITIRQAKAAAYNAWNRADTARERGDDNAFAIAISERNAIMLENNLIIDPTQLDSLIENFE